MYFYALFLYPYAEIFVNCIVGAKWVGGQGGRESLPPCATIDEKVCLFVNSFMAYETIGIPIDESIDFEKGRILWQLELHQITTRI